MQRWWEEQGVRARPVSRYLRVLLVERLPVSSRKSEDGEERVKGLGLTDDSFYETIPRLHLDTLLTHLWASPCCAAQVVPVGGADFWPLRSVPDLVEAEIPGNA